MCASRKFPSSLDVVRDRKPSAIDRPADLAQLRGDRHEANQYYIEDRGQRRGLFVNGEKVESRALNDGDVITFGLEDSYR